MTSHNGTEIRVLAATGVCGSGFRDASLAEAMRRQPHFIGCDCGSTDPGPYPLGAGVTAFPRVAIKRDLRLMLLAARQAGIPLLLGSAGTAGGIPHVAVVKEILCEIAAEERLSFPLAIIQAEQDKTYLKQRLREGRIKPLKPAPPFDAAVIDRASRFVGMMGSEPYLRALDQGAEVVVAGRSMEWSDYRGRLSLQPCLSGTRGGIQILRQSRRRARRPLRDVPYRTRGGALKAYSEQGDGDGDPWRARTSHPQ